jgi:hypothetical protein
MTLTELIPQISKARQEAAFAILNCESQIESFWIRSFFVRTMKKVMTTRNSAFLTKRIDNLAADILIMKGIKL